MFDHALPFWAKAGRDAAGLGFHEHLTPQAHAAEIPYKRLRVQARQVYVFSQAALLGWPDGLEAARHGYEFMTARARQQDGGWARMLARNGDVLDPTADLYDLAFVLFALAWYARASGEAEPMALARQTLQWINRTMRAPVGGYHNTWPPEPGHRQQNPHMHLLEAMLALHETSPDPLFLETAHTLAALLHTRFLDPDTGTLGEFFTDTLDPAPAHDGDHVEPGHHYEWVWLLHQHARLTGAACSPAARRLYHFAQTHGVDQASGAIHDVLGRDGRIRSQASRLWPHTEAIKAHAAMLQQGEPVAASLLASLNRLLGHHLAHEPLGTWHDHFDMAGQPIATRIPSSSFYHIMSAYAELDRLLR
jgi:mannose/cellobiose epimerase-like protein (N-acyl-D-glucosamine 2-epimerase family)